MLQTASEEGSRAANYLSCAVTIGHLSWWWCDKAGFKCFPHDTLETHLKHHSGEKLGSERADLTRWFNMFAQLTASGTSPYSITAVASKTKQAQTYSYVQFVIERARTISGASDEGLLHTPSMWPLSVDIILPYDHLTARWTRDPHWRWLIINLVIKGS